MPPPPSPSAGNVFPPPALKKGPGKCFLGWEKKPMNPKNNGVFAGILGVSCCVVPLILVAAGLVGSLLTVFLVKYKVYLMTLAVAALSPA